MIIKIIISSIALIAVAVHMFFPTLTIDTVTIGLLLVGILPWLSSLFDTVEFPGGWKFHFNLQKTTKNAENAGLFSSTLTKRDERLYSFQLIGENDPNLALAGLRIELEKTLVGIAEKQKIYVKKSSVEVVLELLKGQDILTDDEVKTLKSLIVLLNQAVHGKKIDSRGYEWAMSYGPRLLKTLNAKKTTEVK